LIQCPKRGEIPRQAVTLSGDQFRGKAFDYVPDNRTKNRWASWKRVKEQVPSDLTPDMLPRISKMGNLFLHFRKLIDFIEEKVNELRQHLWK
jgi:hypothetical protein